jgi:choline dehydrogenase
MQSYFTSIENCTYRRPGSRNHGFDGFADTNRNNLSYVLDRPGVVSVMTNWEQEAEGIEIENTRQFTDLITRDTNIPANRYTPGIYQDVTATNENRRRVGAWSNIADTIAAGYSLTLSTRSLATTVVFADDPSCDTPRAVGVEYLVGTGLYGADRRYDPEQTGLQRKAIATKEVIVAGGAFNTPQLLKLSGVGPREELESHDIPVVANVPGVVTFSRRREAFFISSTDILRRAKA